VTGQPRFRVIAPDASPEEAAAIAAALEQFIADTAPKSRGPAQEQSGWLRAALTEGVSRSQLPGRPW
jgi:hypothetical protein